MFRNVEYTETSDYEERGFIVNPRVNMSSSYDTGISFHRNETNNVQKTLNNK